MDFFDDDATSQAPGRDRPARRRRPAAAPTAAAPASSASSSSRRSSSCVVFAMAWWARSCQHNRKVASYRTYFEGVSTAINDSAALGKQLDQVVANPTKFSRKELIAKLAELSAKQNEIAVRADRLEAARHPHRRAGRLRRRHEGPGRRLQAVRRRPCSACSARRRSSPAKLAALAGYFSGPDAYYMSRVYVPARNILSDQGVTDVPVPTVHLLPHGQDLRQRRASQQMLNSVGSSTKLAGVHGVALRERHRPARRHHAGTGRAPSTSRPPPISRSTSRSQNQGDVTEENVAVTARAQAARRNTCSRRRGTIATHRRRPDRRASRIQGFAIPAEALSKVSTLKVTAGPVPGER